MNTNYFYSKDAVISADSWKSSGSCGGSGIRDAERHACTGTGTGIGTATPVQKERFFQKYIQSAYMMKICAIICFLAICFNANAISGNGFSSDNLIRDLKWNQEKGRVEFKVMFFDNWGDKSNEWIKQAYLYINGTNVGKMHSGCPRNGVNGEYSSTPREYEYASLFFYSNSSTMTTNHLATYARGSTAACDAFITNTSAYQEIPINYSPDRWYTYNVNHVTGDAAKVNHAYAEFFWYPGEMTSDQTIEIAIKDIIITEQGTFKTVTRSNVARSVSATRPAAGTHSMSGGTIGSDGRISFTCSASEATEIELLYEGGTSIETKSGSNVTFNTKYLSVESSFLNGRSFSFNSRKSVSDGKTVYVRRSDKSVTSQRASVFWFNYPLNYSLKTCGQVSLSWQLTYPNSSPTTNINTQGFDIQVKKGNEGWTDVSGAPSYVVDPGAKIGDRFFCNYSYTYTIPEADRNKGTVTYQFRVKRKFVEWDDGHFGAVAENRNIFQRNVTASINTDLKELTDIEIKPGKEIYPLITWKMATSGFQCEDNIKLKLKITGGTGGEINIPKDSILTGSYQTSSTDGIDNCTPQKYVLIMQYGTLPEITYTVSNSYIYQAAGKREFESITVSKGYYADRNNIKWTLRNGYDDFKRFRLLRKEASQSDDEYIAVGDEITHNGGVLQYNRDDREINAGVYYIYKIEGIYECSSQVGVLASSTSVGFSQPYGSVSGRVTYSGSQAVKDVQIKLATDNALNSNRELEFDRSRSNSFMNIPAGTKLFSRDGFSIQAWLKFNSSQIDTIVSNSLISVWRATDNKIRVKMANSATTVTAPAVIANGEYNHLTVTVQKVSNYRTYTVRVYIGKTQSVGASVSMAADAVTPTDATVIGKPFTGYLDDLRIWNKALSAAEIADNYDRVLGGKESGLAAYYRFDEIDAAESALFDCSAVGTAFNGNHAAKGAGVNRSNVPVSASHLTIKGVTDANGNYSITNSIPFTSEGTIYTLSPDFGVHQFDPNNRPLFFSPNSQVFNNIDFTDISSFLVEGQVLYAGSNYPVEGAQISIDGIVASKDGEVVETGTDGKFIVEVPIGEHFITVSKQGHVFAGGGRFPANKLKKYNFQTSESGLIFTDQTTVQLKGRVAGGQPQTDRQLGFGLSQANIGKATITLKTVNDVYRLNLTGADSIVDNNAIGGVTSKTTFKNPASGSMIEIETNPVTGEFLAVLPPVPYTVANIKTKEFEDTFIDGDVRDFECSKMVFDINPLIVDTAKYTDTVTKTKHVFVSNDSLKITKYNVPEFFVTDRNNEYGAFGDSIYVYTNSTTGKDTAIRLYNVSGGTVTYTLDVPVLSQKAYMYHWNIKAYEEYINKDAAEWVSDIVPLAGNPVTISNALASERIIVDSVTYDEISRDETSKQTVLDSTGSSNYSFAVSFPNMSGNNRLNAKLTLTSNGKDYVWEKSAILLGQMPSDGNNFVTKGPDHVDIVLHDPPGSNSYAYIEKGSSYTHKVVTTDVNTVTEALTATIHVGPEIVSGTGVGFMVMSKVESKADIEIGTEFEEVFTDNNEKETTITFSQQISTSGDPNYIGSMADVYIGRSTNLIFGMMNQLALYPNSQIPEGVTPSKSVGNFSLFPQRVLTAEQEFATAFTYTQTHVLETQIPNIKELRNQLLETVPNPADSAGLYFGDKAVKYLTALPANHPDFGEPETYYVHYNIKTHGGLKAKSERRDEVWEYNTWILNWEKRISDNEETQIKLFAKRTEYEENKAANAKDIWNKKNIFENVSYDAGVALEKSLEVSYSDLVIDGSSWTAGGSIGFTGGFGWNNVGFTFNPVVGAKREQGKEVSDGTGNSMKFGYVLAEDESVLFAGQDALSVDVYGPMVEEMKKGFELDKVYSLSGYTFQRRAGQTSCPYEEADSTLFYKVNGKPVLKNYGTFKIEKAQLFVDNKPEASVENIPAGREGTFTLQLQNLSEAKMDVTYRLAVDPATNPDGLILELDGAPLTDARQFRIKYGEEVTKVLKVRQSSTDILEYSDIAIRLGSVCDIFDYSEAFISAKFIPSSSPVKLVSDSRLANIEGLQNGGTIRFTVSDYDRTYKNFGCIRLEYRSVTNENWTTPRTYVNDETLYPLDSPDKVKIEGPTCTYDFTYGETVPSDGEYIFRAVAVSKIGTQEITFESEEIRVVKDTKAPQALGYPSPVNGILNAGDEISVTFNEEIQSGKLIGGTVGSNFSITGILNGDIREEPASGVAFSGSQSAYTEMPIYTGGPFSIETWFKRTNNTVGTLFAYGSGNEYISLGFDATGKVKVTIGDESYTSAGAINNSDDTWKYIGMAYDRESGTVSVNAYQGTQSIQLFNSKTFTKTPATQGKLYLGNNAAGNSGFSGAVSLLHFYNFARTGTQMTDTKSLTKSGTENGLIGLWELEEDEGALAKDKARSRHLTLNNTTRYIYPLGKSRAFNGTSQYVHITGGVPFGIYADFTFEFWFKGGEQNAANLLSVGTETHIGFDSGGNLILTAGDGSVETLHATSLPSLLDNKWHHFALSVKRNGMARASIDGVATVSFNSSFFGDIGSYYHLGVKYARHSSGNGFTYSEYFKGNIDELRIWNSALTAEAIVYNKNHSLRGDESGLKVYYPFEKTVQVSGSVYSVNPSLVDAVNSSLTATGSAASSDDSAPLQLARPVKNVPYTFTASNSRIVLNLAEEEYRIDGVTLCISAENILDMHDNTSSAVNWIAYVNRNALNWNIGPVDIVMEEGGSHTFKAAISNSSGEKLDYFIEDLPSWLSVDASQGSLNPLSTKELTFSVASGVNTGAYEASPVLTGLNSVKKILPVTLKVTGERPDWQVNPSDYEQSMTVVGQLMIKDFPQEDPDDMLAAFTGNTCVGIASPKFESALQAYLIYMQVWGNSSDNGAELTFKIWDASTGNIYPLVTPTIAGSTVSLKYSSNSLKGTPDVPVKFNAGDAVEQSILLNAGWNWVSFSVVSPNLSDVNSLMNNTGNGIEIKSQSSFSRYDSDSSYWTNGTMNGEGLDNSRMYMVRMSGANAVSLPGSPVDVDSAAVNLGSGWNWIAYLPQVNETVSEAFAGAGPSGGDVVKSQTDFSVYVNNVGWVGTLEYMRPGQGYMYSTAAARTFKYPKRGIMTRSGEGDPAEGEPPTLNRPHPSLNSEIAPKYESNLSFIGEVKLRSESLSESARLLAYVGNECRGIAEARKVGDKYLFFLPVYSNSASETVYFQLENDGKEIPLREYITYKPNGMLGTPSSPVILTDANINLKAYPNPFIDRITASFEIEERGARVRVELVSVTGAMIYSTVYTVENPGPQQIDIDGAVTARLTEGKYVLRVTLDGKETFTNIIIKGTY